MASFAAVNFPMLHDDGIPSQTNPERWRLNADLKRGVVIARSGATERILPFASLLAIDIGSEKEVRAIGKTIGRMALSGVGAALFSRGREGGVGASLLDLSFRGAEHQQMISGIMVWPNLCVAQFDAKGGEIEQLSQFIPREAFEQESLNEAEEMLGLVARMKDDGLRSLVEIANETVTLNRQTKLALDEAEKGASFRERDSARQEAKALEHELIGKRHVCIALMCAMNVSAHDLLADLSVQDAASVDLLGVDIAPPKKAESQPASAGVTEKEQKVGKSRRGGGLLLGCGALLALAFAAKVWLVDSNRQLEENTAPAPPSAPAPPLPAPAPVPAPVAPAPLNPQENDSQHANPMHEEPPAAEPKPDERAALPPNPALNGATPQVPSSPNTTTPQGYLTPPQQQEENETVTNPPSQEVMQEWVDNAIKEVTENASKSNVNSNLEGTVTLHLTVDGSGRVVFVSLAKPARNGYINFISQQIARQSRRFAPPPDGQQHVLLVVLSFPIQRQSPASGDMDPSAAGRY